MRSFSIILTGALILSVFGAGFAYAGGETDDPAVLLRKGIAFFKDYQFAEATAALRSAKRSDDELKKLDAAQREELSHYLDESAKGRRAYTEAVECTELADKLLSAPNVGEAELDQARQLYERALRHKKYLPTAKVDEIEVGMKKVAAASSEMQALTAPATVNETEADQDEALSPEANENADKQETVLEESPSPVMLAKAPAPQTAPTPVQPTLLDRHLQARAIQKQQALASLKAAEQGIRNAVVAEEFLVARDELSRARQELYRNRSLFSQTEFEKLLLDIDSLASFIEVEQQAHQKRQVAAQVQEAEQKRLEREQRIQEEKFNKISELYADVVRLRKERKFEEAIDKARQILVIDPTYDRARWVIEDLQDLTDYRQQVRDKAEMERRNRNLFTQSDEARVPITSDIEYPADWVEVSRSRKETLDRLGKTLVGELPARVTERKLEGTMIKDVTPLRGTLREAFNFFKSQGVRMFVRWEALEFEGITPDSDVNYDALEGLTDVTLKTAMELLLKTVGGEVNYGVNTDGFVIVATRDSLMMENLTPRMGRLETRVYNISDVMEYTPTFSSIPEVEPQQEEESIQLDEIEAKEYEDLASLEDLVEVLRYMIQSLVRPESWREMGGEGTIDVWRNRWLIVYQTPEVHDEIDEMLEGLREVQTVQIAMEARFVTVSSNFLERIGVDLDVIFNQAHAGYDYTGVENTWGNMVPAGFGSAVVQPRTFSTLGSLPVSPTAGAGVAPAGYTQPYGHFGLIPNTGNSSWTSSKWTPVPMLQNSLGLTSPENTGVPGNLASTAGPAFQVMGSFLDDLQVNFLLEATQLDRYSSIVQAPRVVMQNGALGYIAVQTDVPYVEEVEVALGETSGGTEPQVETMGFGTVLACRPSTRDLRYVNLYIVPQVTLRAPDADLLYETTVVSQGAVSVLTYLYPGKRTTRVETTVSVPDEGTLLLGGLRQAGEIEREAGVPVLSKLPILKRFFSNRAVTKDNFTLLVLVKPKILVREELEPGYFEGL